MAPNRQRQQYKIPGAFPDAKRDIFGCTEDDYVQMMDEVMRDEVATAENASTPKVEQRVHQPSANTAVPGSRGRGPVTAQQDSRNTRPERSSHVGSSLSGQGDNVVYPYSHNQQVLPPNPFATLGNTYPTPPAGWGNDLDIPSQDLYHNSQSSASSAYGGAYRGTHYAQYDTSNHLGPGSQLESLGPQPPPPSWIQGQPSRTAIPDPVLSQQSAHFGTSRLHRNSANLGVAQGFTSTQSPYARDVRTSNAYSQPRSSLRPPRQVIQAQPSQRQPTVPALGEEIRDREDPLEELVKEDSGKGLTRTNANGELEWFAKPGSKGVLAVRHDDIRAQLIAIAEAERVRLGVQYDHPDEAGPGRYNVTSFYRKHIHWGPNRKDRPDMLFTWEEDRESNPRPKCPGYMYWEQGGKKYIVLDPHDNPIKDWDIPLTIASNIPGYKLEAMRRQNMSLGHKDFWARMPRRINIGTGRQPEELGKPNAIVNMPMERFRFHAGLCSWTERKKTSTIKAGLKKLYGNKLQNNSVRAFGRDLTNKEIAEIKKGDHAVFPVEGDVVPTTAKPPRKRKYLIEADEDSSAEGESLPQTRSRKRVRQGRKEDSIATEVDDLVMFEQPPVIIDEEDATRRYPLRSTRREPGISRRSEQIEEVSDKSSTNEDYEERPTRRYTPRDTPRVGKARQSSKRNKISSRESSAEEEGDYVPTWIVGSEEAHGESDEVDSASQKSTVETDDEEERSPRFPFRRIPGATDVGGKCKGPSWTSSTSETTQSTEEKDSRKAVVPIYIGDRVHYATYEGLISNGPDPRVGGADTLPERRDTEIADAPVEQNESDSPSAHPFELTMNMPFLEQRNVEDDNTPLQAHRKRVREFLGEEEPEAQARPSKRLRTEQQNLPIPRLATDGATSDIHAQLVQPQVDRSGRAPSVPHARASEIRKQKLDAEWAQVFEQTFLDLGLQSVNYSEVPPWNDQEAQSLIDALFPTREVYFAWTGEPAPRTDPQQCYRAQFDTIFEAFMVWWQTHRSSEELPILSGVMHWGRSVDDWIPPSKDSIYYEAFQKGHRAQRGGLPDWSGPRAEDALRVSN